VIRASNKELAKKIDQLERKLKDGLPKLRDFPKELGGSDIAVPE
jgi:hypothetical protein